jgi:hypothetical protein
MAEPARTRPRAADRDALVATKLRLPRSQPGFVVRPRLLERLAEGATRELTLVCAPAGFGKTSLLADWAHRSPLPVAWLSLDPGDNDPIRAGLHTGEVEPRDGDVRGIAVHIAARVMAAARPGDILTSRTVRDLIVGSDIVLTDQGAQTLKGVEGTWQLFSAHP